MGGTLVGEVSFAPAPVAAADQKLPNQKLATQAQDKFKSTMDKAKSQIKSKGGMQRVVVDGAKIVCDQTLPPQTMNTLNVPDPRPTSEGKAVANIEDVERGKNISPWPCKCKMLPAGSDFQPCNYNPSGKWRPGVKSEDSQHSSPQKSNSPSSSKNFDQGYRDGYNSAMKGLDRIDGNPASSQAIQNAANATGVSPDTLKSFAIAESGGNAAIGTNAYGYTGMMQMGQDAASEVGYSMGQVTGAANVGNNVMAAAKYMRLNQTRLPSGTDFNALNSYLSHQQGAGGFSQMTRALQNNPFGAASRNMLSNVPSNLKNGLTNQGFHDYWKGKFKGIEDAMKAKKSAPGGPQKLTVCEKDTHKCAIGGNITIADPGQQIKKADPN